MVKREKSKLRQLIEEYGIKDMQDVSEFVKMLTAETIQEVLDGELENEQGYSKYDYKNKQTDNRRNGYSTKTVRSSQGEIAIKIPRDRNGEYEPQLVKKHQMDISGIEDKIIFMCQRDGSGDTKMGGFARLRIAASKPCLNIKFAVIPIR